MEIKPEVVKREQSDGAQQITSSAAVNVTNNLHSVYIVQFHHVITLK